MELAGHPANQREATLIIMIPDYLARATISAVREHRGIIYDIRTLYPNARIMPVLNGERDPEKASEMLDIGESVGLQPIASTHDKRKLVGALMTGYDYVATNFGADEIVIRLDTAEHDIAYIGKLATVAKEYGAVVGDLDFTNGHLVDGTYDYWIHTRVFPALYEGMTGGKLRLSCAHGFQAYRVGVLREILPQAKLLVERVEKNLAAPLTWGFDGVMAIVATCGLGGVRILPVPAQSDRNRDVEKIDAQLKQHAALLKAAAELHFI